MTFVCIRHLPRLAGGLDRMQYQHWRAWLSTLRAWQMSQRDSSTSRFEIMAMSVCKSTLNHSCSLQQACNACAVFSFFIEHSCYIQRNSKIGGTHTLITPASSVLCHMHESTRCRHSLKMVPEFVNRLREISPFTLGRSTTSTK